ncbi:MULTISPECIES: NAD-dependent epimerase/dehydratase family protein [Streptomyces]|uniref:dTDP-glucose 4,6-dehydratase n=1 Tax=Streptomyces venezuelae (strain ATCC 10712 / CBS 650.69 / DSM 40230 / JCM 4526 / NBRC 13096 / PD 04745) TaxID=953739 RepID=F2REQ0_STRVP|nr:NAD(P)-dependent oxidoreductase [Streptomyces venezuelae]APE25040.1 dTDP-glucose 4,6-dehydratase [Streptomyces venezuelae]QES02381.1 NAD(P)-dependent oxidoreductase [Streptomyces venezuelae ATCC 10712]CCA59585.1 dTDP-glucose 4,6-dehydratase [Streptomyces venezuelae ATCC 10712]
MRVLVAGATGAVGRQLVPRLQAAGHEVVGLSRRGPVPVDVLDAGAVRRAVAEAAPDVVVHQLTDLGSADGAANNRVRVEGTRNLVDAARSAGVRRIVAQSISWAYAPGDGPADESVPLDPTEEAPRSRIVAGVRALESAVAELPEAVVLRYGVLYGPGTWYAPGGPVAAALAGDPAARFLGSTAADASVSSFVHVADAADAAVRALTWPPGAYNVVDDEPAPGHDWLPVLAAALGVPAPRRSEGRAPWARGALNARARGLGWAPVRPSWRTGFADQGTG